MLLVALQFALILLLAFPLPLAMLSSAAAMLLLAAGVLLGLWTLCFNRIGNFNIRPEPKPGTTLVTTGPYRYVRHPMYVAVLLVMAPFAFLSGEPVRIVFWFLLLAVLWKKSSVEERVLMQRFDGYGRYRESTGRFLPRLSGGRMGGHAR